MKKLMFLMFLLQIFPAHAKDDPVLLSKDRLDNYAFCAAYLTVLSGHYLNHERNDKAVVAMTEAEKWQKAGEVYMARNPAKTASALIEAREHKAAGTNPFTQKIEKSMEEAQAIIYTNDKPVGTIKAAYEQHCEPMIGDRDALLGTK